MKKTLLIAAATLAAGIISSQADPVYSQNIVGYVNSVFKGGGAFNMVCNPLTAGTNTADQIITSMVGNESIYLWDSVNGGYYVYSYLGKNSGLTYDWVDSGIDPIPNAQPDGSVPPPVINPGTAFFYTCNFAQTNTWVGTVVSSNSVPLKGGGAFNMVSSGIPFAGSIENTNFSAILQANDSVWVWDTVNGGYYVYSYLGKNSGLTYDWVDSGIDAIPNAQPDGSVPPPSLNVGQGFFYTTTSATNWVQKLSL